MRPLATPAALAALAALAVAACRDPSPPPPRPAPLAAYLRAIAPADRAAEVARWRLDRVTWDRTVVDAYAGLHADYARAFEAAVPALIDRLAAGGEVATRAHYAGDPRLTLDQARARWALPVQYPSEVATIGGAPLDVVFVRDAAGAWRAITGLGEILRARAAAIDPACAAHLARVHPGRCGDLGWMIADALLRTDPRRFAHACALATHVCPK